MRFLQLSRIFLGPADDEDFRAETLTVSKIVFLYKEQPTAHKSCVLQDKTSHFQKLLTLSCTSGTLGRLH